MWIHGDCLSPQNAALLANPDAPTVWVWDEALLARWSISLKRIVFICECLLELPVEIQRGDVAEQLTAFARQQGATQIATADSPSPRFVSICETLQRSGLTVSIFPDEPLVTYQGRLDLKRFSRYWRVAQRHALGVVQNR